MTDSKLPVPASNAARRRSRRLADAYLVAADAPATVRAYTADWKHFSAWCLERSIQAIPAEPALVGRYLAELGEGYARSTLRRKVAAIARANRMAGAALDTRHTAIRDVLRGIGRTHGLPARRAQALTTDEVQQLVASCGNDLVGLRDRAILLVTFAGALRRSELCAIEVEHVRWKRRGFELLIPHSKTDPEAEGDRIVLTSGEHASNLSRARSPGLAGGSRDPSGSHVPCHHPAWHDQDRCAQWREHSSDRGQTGRADGIGSDAAGADLAARPARGIRDHGLSQRRAGRGNHGAYTAP